MEPASRRTAGARAWGRLAVILGICVLALAGCASNSATGVVATPKNIIIMFADGAAPTQWDFGRYSSKVLRNQSFATTDVVFREGVLGLLTTSPHGPYVTDSAAAASAMSTGHKVPNGYVAVGPDDKDLDTAMRIAKRGGKRIGLVTTAAVYDATPAAFSINMKDRRKYPEIVNLYEALAPDVLLGGGMDFFVPLKDPKDPGGKRTDGKNIVDAFRAKGHAFVSNATELNAATGPKLLGLFSDGPMDLEIDRDPVKEPSTAEMTAAALKALSQQSPKGFVLLVENENTDAAGHGNDAAALMHALWAFDDAVKVALEFQRRHPDTLVLVTADHETGGFSPTYALKDRSSRDDKNRIYAGEEQLRMLSGIRMSFRALKEMFDKQPVKDAATLDRLLAPHFPGFQLDDDLRKRILGNDLLELSFINTPHNVLGMMVARQTGFYWGTGGHTPEPVAVGAIGPGAELFRGFQDNTDFGKHLHRLIQGK